MRLINILILLPPVIAIGCDQPAARPIVQIPSAIDLGEINVGESARALIEVRNDTPDDAFLTGVQASCTCTTVDFHPQSLPSGETCVIPVLFSPGTKTGPVFTACVVSYSQDGATRQVPVRLSATVRSSILLSPDHLEFGGAPDTQEIHVTSRNVTRVLCDHPAFHAQHDSSRITVSFDPSKWPKFKAGASLTVHTDTEQMVVPLQVGT